MFQSDQPPSESNGEVVNPTNPPSYDLFSDATSQAQLPLHLTTNTVPCKTQKMMTNDLDAPNSPHTTTSILKVPKNKLLSRLHPQDRCKDILQKSLSAGSISIGETMISKTPSSNNSNFKTCKICSDKANKEHFNVLVCDSCRGFFKRAVKNGKIYKCIGSKACVLTKKSRNHCQYCRLEGCYKAGMNKEAAELEIEREKEEKEQKKKKDGVDVVFCSESQPDTVDLELIKRAELFVDPKITAFANVSDDLIRQLFFAADKELASLAEWAKRLPHFTDLDIMDQVKLLQWNCHELLIGGFCYRSSAVSDGFLLSTGLHVSRESLEKAGIGLITNKLFSEIIDKMKTLQIDISEWGCLRAIMLFAPDTKELSDVDKVENIRDRYIATLCNYITEKHPDDKNRLGSLLLRLAPLKEIALQFSERLLEHQLIGDVPIDTFLLEIFDVHPH